jgi:hypothetical protein
VRPFHDNQHERFRFDDVERLDPTSVDRGVDRSRSSSSSRSAKDRKSRIPVNRIEEC